MATLAQIALLGDRPSNAFAKIQLQRTAHAPASPSPQLQNAIAPQTSALLLPYLKQPRHMCDRHTQVMQWTLIALVP
jgi:hypothetical protein